MSTWLEFYSAIRDPAWPNCEKEEDFFNLPTHIQQECSTQFGYVPGQFRKSSKLEHKVFPIVTDTACQLKWNWSTIYLTTEKTASCHRTSHHSFDPEVFDFHNTPEKLHDRTQMLDGKWPTKGCEYCQSIEDSGGQSDRITNLDFPGMHAPVELENNPAAVQVTPRILEVYFNNTCNLKCLYCGDDFSSLWQSENQRFGPIKRDNTVLVSTGFKKSPNIESNMQKIFQWIRSNGHNLTNFNFLGGEPLFQPELDQVLDLFDQHPAPELKLQIFTNLNVRLDRVKSVVEKVRLLIEKDKLRAFEITASLDCWGISQEYVRYPLDLKLWEENFEYLLEQDFINLVISSTVTPLTIKTLPDLLSRVNQWHQRRPIYHYQNSVNGPSYMFIDIFGDIFVQDFEAALKLKPDVTSEQKSSKQYLSGIAKQSASQGPNVEEIKNLFCFLNEIDRRRRTSWPKVFPWLVTEFAKYNLVVDK
jgi:organic radical activating enzyme